MERCYGTSNEKCAVKHKKRLFKKFEFEISLFTIYCRILTLLVPRFKFLFLEIKWPSSLECLKTSKAHFSLLHQPSRVLFFQQPDHSNQQLVYFVCIETQSVAVSVNWVHGSCLFLFSSIEQEKTKHFQNLKSELTQFLMFYNELIPS